MFRNTNIISGCVKNVQKNGARSVSFQSVKNFISMYLGGSSKDAKPPYNYICQIGDPVLRQKTTPIDPNVIQTEEFQKMLEKLSEVMKKYKTVGLAAPQIGFPWQVFALEITEKSLKNIPLELQQCCKMETHPLTYFINPTMEIIDPTETSLYEMCGSIHCYHAEVPRYTEVQIKALNRFGQPFCWNAKNWLARIAQHEMDHLEGIVYTDKMYPHTFEFYFWRSLSKNHGKMKIKYP